MSVGGGAALAAHGAEAPLTAKAIMRQSGRAFLRTPPSQQLPSAASGRVHRSAIGSAEHYERRENFRHGGGIPNYFFFLQPVTDGMRKCPNALRAAAPVAAAPVRATTNSGRPTQQGLEIHAQGSAESNRMRGHLSDMRAIPFSSELSQDFKSHRSDKLNLLRLGRAVLGCAVVVTMGSTAAGGPRLVEVQTARFGLSGVEMGAAAVGHGISSGPVTHVALEIGSSLPRDKSMHCQQKDHAKHRQKFLYGRAATWDEESGSAGQRRA
ncbi:hypothetical protein PaG_01582 [Moesziomyces aphidis]|uniref:Uncharacterized protein n=1 Tax=Moesziomyces aphidis TaxID=84754 RepID=W3VPA6_MOEAP|nr:hypothetical protein PaG_01582 [Moesziomyces aphidis]